ncbi:hypothetical protein M404DRAFT_25478 [Pisolithus tinctorius Marx 270]|uniref:Uncharacterized protein n=1 Tax=Pisolithus tinctorius Marx 270 TaxID=870435 RepID=A0A0C3NWV8_PISTI|nr:hypothetical protein M404DRAFT_25478 [Pisolithus tinctorius Marx 270]
MHEHAYTHPRRVVIRKKRTLHSRKHSLQIIYPSADSLETRHTTVVPPSDVNNAFSDPESHGHITPRFFEPDTKY